MDILWAESSPLTAREVGRLIADRDLAPTTVMTVLDRLTRKGFLQPHPRRPRLALRARGKPRRVRRRAYA